jgi:hypothetical protein
MTSADYPQVYRLRRLKGEDAAELFKPIALELAAAEGKVLLRVNALPELASRKMLACNAGMRTCVHCRSDIKPGQKIWSYYLQTNGKKKAKDGRRALHATCLEQLVAA